MRDAASGQAGRPDDAISNRSRVSEDSISESTGPMPSSSVIRAADAEIARRRFR